MTDTLGLNFLGVEMGYGWHTVKVDDTHKYEERKVTFDYLDADSGLLEGRDQYGENVQTTITELESFLHRSLESARNYSYEANMGDYSMDSIRGAKRRLDAIKRTFEDVGLEIPAW